MVQQAGGRPCRSSTFRFIPSIAIYAGRPWASPSHGLASATGEEMVAAMNLVGVDGAIMVSSFSAYEYDPSYALEVYNTYPDKFRVVTPVDATDPAIDDVVAKWAATPGARGICIRMREGLPMDADHPGLNGTFAAAGRHGLPVNLLCWGILRQRAAAHRAPPRYGDRHRPSRPLATDSPAGPRRCLGRSSKAPRLGSIRERKGEDQRRLHDVAPTVPIRRYLGAGAAGHRCVRGLHCCMWGTDWTRTIGMLTYEQGVAPFRDTKRLSETDKSALMGGTLQKVYKW